VEFVWGSCIEDASVSMLPPLKKVNSRIECDFMMVALMEMTRRISIRLFPKQFFEGEG
jgi:hypothetical protein